LPIFLSALDIALPLCVSTNRIANFLVINQFSGWFREGRGTMNNPHGGAADSYYSAPQQPPPQQQTQQPYGMQEFPNGSYPPPQRGYEDGAQPQYNQAPPTYAQNHGGGNGYGAPKPTFHSDQKQSFEQTFKIEKPKYNDVWAGILVSNAKNLQKGCQI
jgi:hypothetical protein